LLLSVKICLICGTIEAGVTEALGPMQY
jgi:hypothetical protein